MDIVFLDFETYYDNTLSLSKLTLEEYITSDEYSSIMMSYAVNDSEVKVVNKYDIPDVLASLELHKKAVCAHNVLFDGAVLRYRYGIVAKLYLDTASMARASGIAIDIGSASLKQLSDRFLGIGEIVPKMDTVLDMNGKRYQDINQEQMDEYKLYCSIDTTNCRTLFKILSGHVSLMDGIMIDTTIRMFVEPRLQVNDEYIKAYLDKESSAITGIEENLSEELKEHGIILDPSLVRSVFASSVKLAKLIEDLNFEVPMKKNEKGIDKPAFRKTDPELVAFARTSPFHARLVAYKTTVSSNILETRSNRLLGISERIGKLPVELIYSGAHTGRYSGGGKINPQNFPSRGDKRIKRAVTPPEGYVLVGADSSQIEARVNAYYAQDIGMMRVFANGQDPYCYMASQLFNVPYEEMYHKSQVEPEEAFVRHRSIGKECVLGLGYGMGVDKFYVTVSEKGLNIPFNELQQYVDMYRSIQSKIVMGWKWAGEAIRAMIRGQTFEFGGVNNRMYRVDRIEEGNPNRFLNSPSIITPGNGRLVYPGISVANDGRSFFYVKRGKTDSKGNPITIKLYGAKLVENLIQETAFRIIKWQGAKLVSEGVPLALNTHDAFLSVVPRSKLDETIEKYKRIMSSSPSWISDILLSCKVSVGDNYADMKDI